MRLDLPDPPDLPDPKVCCGVVGGAGPSWHALRSEDRVALFRKVACFWIWMTQSGSWVAGGRSWHAVRSPRPKVGIERPTGGQVPWRCWHSIVCSRLESEQQTQCLRNACRPDGM